MSHDEVIHILRSRLKERLGRDKQLSPLDDDAHWAGTDSLPYAVRTEVDAVEKELVSRGYEVSYMDLCIALVQAMTDLGKLRSNGKGHWPHIPEQKGVE